MGGVKEKIKEKIKEIKEIKSSIGRGCGSCMKTRCKKNSSMIVLLVLIVILGVRCYLVTSKIDESAPVITYPDGVLTYHEGEDERELLSDVRAMDTIDGDVSDTLIVEKIYPDEDEKKAIVTYAAIDKSYNLGKVSRMVEYEAAKESSVAPNPTEEPTPTGGASTTVDPESTSSPTTSQSQGDDSSTMIVGYKPIMYLKTDEIIINKYGSFELVDFIAGVVDDKDTETQLLNNLSKDGTYTRRVEGTYEMILYVIDSDGNESNREHVRLVVE